MKCKLCLKDKDLLKKSHIIPQFMHKGLRDGDGKFFRISIDDFSKSQAIYTGEFESDILCQECDNNILGGLEGYASRLLYGGQLYKGENIKFENRKNQYGVAMTNISGIDYEKFKLFLLSLLWRASISNRNFYQQVDLGPHEDIIRKMILGGNPDDYKQYPCLIATYLNHKELPPALVGQPIRVKSKDGTRYVFLIGGFIYMFFVSSHAIPDWIFELVINENQEINILHMSEDVAKDMLNHFLGIEMFK